MTDETAATTGLIPPSERDVVGRIKNCLGALRYEVSEEVWRDVDSRVMALVERFEAQERLLDLASTMGHNLEARLEAAQAENRMLRMWLCTDGARARGLAESMMELPTAVSLEGIEENAALIVELLNIEQRLGLPSASSPASKPPDGADLVREIRDHASSQEKETE